MYVEKKNHCYASFSVQDIFDDFKRNKKRKGILKRNKSHIFQQHVKIPKQKEAENYPR